MYTIEVHYTTGNSFNSEETTDQIGLQWEDKQLARKALQSLREHYVLYEDKESFRSRNSREEIAIKAMAHDWYKIGIAQEKEKYYKNSSYWHYYCAVLMDDGVYRNLPVGIWCGYFETLHWARIVTVENAEDEDYVKF